MTIGAGDPGRARTAPTERDRVRVVATIRGCASEGLLSPREVEERLEEAFRVRTMAELDSVASGLPYSAHVAADMVLTHGLTVAAPKAERPWWRGILIRSLLFNVIWVIIWLITGGAVGWLVLAIVSTTVTFTVRFATRHRRFVAGKPARRRGSF